MGILKGDLDLIGVGNLIQSLAINGRQGILTLFRGMDKKSIYIGAGGMRLLSSTMKQANRLGRILVRRNCITTDTLKKCLEQQRQLKVKLGDLLTKSKLVSSKVILDALKEQIEEEIFDMFMWEGAAFEFAEGPPRKAETPLADITFDANITSVILEAARRADEMRVIRRLVNDEGSVLIRTMPEMFDGILGEDQDCGSAIFPLVDGHRPIRDIIDRSMYPRFATLRALYRLIEKGFIKPVSVDNHSTVIIMQRPGVPPAMFNG